MRRILTLLSAVAITLIAIGYGVSQSLPTLVDGDFESMLFFDPSQLEGKSFYVLLKSGNRPGWVQDATFRELDGEFFLTGMGRQPSQNVIDNTMMDAPVSISWNDVVAFKAYSKEQLAKYVNQRQRSPLHE